jgi:diguanylate cyclase (GGDEF)-like protein
MLKNFLNILPTLHFRQMRPFLISLCVIITLIFSAIFIFIDKSTSKLMMQRVREQAVTYIDLINHAKTWNFNYGGVYVEKKNNVKSNIYLKGLGKNPDVDCGNGRTFTIRNHAIMIAEFSQSSEHQDGVKFRMVSLKPLDPANTPDRFEQNAFTYLNTSRLEYSDVVQSAGGPIFRYVAPLFADSSCLECHLGPEIKLGAILGAISVSIPIQQLVIETNQRRLIILLSAVILIGFLISITYFLTYRLAADLEKAQTQLQTMALTDELTGLNNRRQVMARLEQEFQRAIRVGETICLISLDIDHFKRINDTYGHQFGDVVLKRVSERMKSSLRPYDIVGRVGGEEFLIVAPTTPPEEAVALAQRIITAVHEETFVEGATKINVTASAGVAVSGPGVAEVEDLIRKADQAMYQAKVEGRNRVAGP